MPELYYWIDKESGNENYTSDGDLNDLVIVATPDGVYVFEMDEDDGYRSHCVPYTNYDNVTLWAKCEADLQNRKTVVYDKIEYNISGERNHGNETYSYPEQCDWHIRAWRDGKVVFEIGTDNTDDYYPSYFLMVEGEQIY